MSKVIGNSPDLSLQRPRRVRKSSEFRKIQDSGYRLHCKHFTLVIKLRHETPGSRLGITVSKKVDKRAVVRNRIKRRIREIIRVLFPRFIKDAEVVVIAKPGAGDLESAEIRSELANALNRDGMLRADP